MQGSGSCSDADGAGIIPRAVAAILETARRQRVAGWEYRLEASYVEVYNESLRDLLAADAARGGGKLAADGAGAAVRAFSFFFLSRVFLAGFPVSFSFSSSSLSPSLLFLLFFVVSFSHLRLLLSSLCFKLQTTTSKKSGSDHPRR